MSRSTTAPERPTTQPAAIRADVIRALLSVGQKHSRMSRAVEELIPLVTADQDRRVELNPVIAEFPPIKCIGWHWRTETNEDTAPLGETVAICSVCAPGPEGSAAYRRSGLHPGDAALDEPGTVLICVECGAEAEID
jgi:hypothetical protein